MTTLKNIFSFSLCALLLVTCDKVDLPNIGTVTVNESCDTIFSFSAATQTHRNILVEDFTGHLCGNCPEAAHELDQLHDIYGDTLIVISIHPNTSFNEVQTGTGKYETDWKIEEAEQLPIIKPCIRGNIQIIQVPLMIPIPIMCIGMF